MHQAIQLLGVQPQAIGQLLPGSLKKHQARLRNPTGDCGFVRLIRAPHLSEAQSVDEMKAKNVALLRRGQRNLLIIPREKPCGSDSSHVPYHYLVPPTSTHALVDLYP